MPDEPPPEHTPLLPPAYVVIVEVRVGEMWQISSHRFRTKAAAELAAQFLEDANHLCTIIED